MSKNISLCLFSFISLFLHPSALLSSVLDLLSDRLFAHVGKDGQQQLQARFVCVTVTRWKGKSSLPTSPMKVPGMSLVGLSGMTSLSRINHDGREDGIHQLARLTHGGWGPSLNPVDRSGGGSGSPKENRDAVFLSRGN